MRFAFEWYDDSGSCFRSYGNENWEFADNGLMQRLLASQRPIKESERKFDRDRSGPRPMDVCSQRRIESI